jgi:acyl-CoA dehydrogenase
MKSIFYTEAHEMFRSSIREFLAKEVIPNIDTWEKNQKVDRSIFKKMGEMGYLGLEVDEKYGGTGLDHMYSCILNQELARTGCIGFASTIAVHSYLAMNYLTHGASTTLKQKYLIPSCKGEIIGSLGMTEPFAGSDLKAIKTTATLKGDEYIINGSKTFITNAYYGDYCVVAAKTEFGISMFVVDLNTSGITKSKLNKLGLHSSDTAELGFNNVHIPKDNLIGEQDKGFYYMMESLQIERLSLSQANIGIMEYVLDTTLQYISERKAFGQTINNFQTLRHSIAEMATEVEAWKIFMEHTSYRFSLGEQIVKECSMLKLKTSDLINEIVYKCLQMFGGYGFIEDYPIARIYRDVRVLPIYGGTSEIMKEIISKIVIEQKKYTASY